MRVQPRARRDEVVLAADGTLRVWLTAPALEGRANRALVELLAERLAVRRAEVRIVAGERGRDKVVELPLAGAEALASRLQREGR